MRLPMPGHFTGDEFFTQTFENLQKLEEFIKSSDVILNCFDSREARYLPCLLGSIHQKPVLSVGIGFDSFVSVLQNQP